MAHLVADRGDLLNLLKMHAVAVDSSNHVISLAVEPTRSLEASGS
jgi:hypothetical protein